MAPYAICCVGSLLECTPRYLIGTIVKNCERLKYHIYDIFVCHIRFTVVSNLADVQEILMKRPKVFRRSRIYQTPITLIGLEKSVALVESSIWSNQRKVFSPPFSKMNVASTMSDIHEESEKFCVYLKDLATSSDNAVDMLHASTYFGCKAFGKVAFGISDDEKNYFFSLQYVEDLSDMLQYISQRMLFPLPQFIWRWSPKYSYEIKAKEASERFQKCAEDVIRNAQNDLNDPNIIPPLHLNFVGNLLKAFENKKFSHDEMISNVLVVAMAGTDPVAVGLCWALYFLSQNPKICHDLRKELSSLDATLPISEQYNGMKLCQACYTEAIRLHGPAFHIDLQPIDKNSNVVLQSGTIIRPNDNILIPLEALKTHPDVFEKPKEFNPYRWMVEDKEKLQKMNRYCLTFGHGPRICPGYEIAPAMGTIALASIVKHFTFQLACPPEEIYRIVAFTVTMNKMPFIFTPIKYID